MADEQRANLAALEMGAAQPDQAAALIESAEADAQAAAQGANTGQVRMILALAVPVLGKLYPCLIDIYDDTTCEQVAGTLGPVLTKYGIDLGDLGGKWGPEIAAIMVCGPVAFATYKGIMADIASRGAQVPKAVASTAPQGRETVTLG